MRAVVDTNVVAYYLLGTKPFVDEATHFWRHVESPLAPALWEAELANVIWMATRAGLLDLAEGQRRLMLAGRIGIRSVASRSLWQGALVRAFQSGMAVYDTLFVELAARQRLSFISHVRPEGTEGIPGDCHTPERTCCHTVGLGRRTSCGSAAGARCRPAVTRRVCAGRVQRF